MQLNNLLTPIPQLRQLDELYIQLCLHPIPVHSSLNDVESPPNLYLQTKHPLALHDHRTTHHILPHTIVHTTHLPPPAHAPIDGTVTAPTPPGKVPSHPAKSYRAHHNSAR